MTLLHYCINSIFVVFIIHYTYCIYSAPQVLAQEITDINLLRIVSSIKQCTDQECNDLAWKCLGYVYKVDSNSYDTQNVFPKWRAKYEIPPDLIGTTRNYADAAIDRPVRDASMSLMRSIPR